MAITFNFDLSSRIICLSYALSNFSLGALVLPRRPGFGTKGRRINLATNFFEIKFKDHDIFQYDVTIEPKCPTALNRMIIQTLVKEYSKIFQQDKPVFDGKKNVYTIRQLPFGMDKVFSFFWIHLIFILE